ncbi:hypothetical protein P152DRAFT_480397 [Eremomyces bilateralis CBS 781.70]|uniref:NmrA-like domain-containing protein n=1 Tax=Eremomyces bilateralis CBS 781.70 TaxID=1392243 RepID=A0A6G1G7U7_9PEZI|nr:uncharacterized protein P152DRAFT_480397 [Eremomyces bilateralis CBS 781.70]KAF1814175.1 hypothetical protein P152DRAFT_480397 [Eremomyces bilateralis CBS 781.70]
MATGKYLVPHFEGKNRVDAFIRSNKTLLAKTTFLWITFYISNYSSPVFTPNFIPTCNKYAQFANYSPETMTHTIGDVRANIGPFVKAVIEQPDWTRNGAIVKAAIGDTTAGGLLQTWAKVNRVAAAFVQTDDDTFHNLWPVSAEELGILMRFWDEVKERSWTDDGPPLLDKNDLGIDVSSLVELETSLNGLAVSPS